MRTAKTVNNTSIDQTRETKYYYDSDNKLIAIYGLFGNIMQFYYDGDGKINSMSYAGEMYYYVTNLQGDVTKLVKSDGTVAANYEYDAWGKLFSVTDANGKTIGSSLHIGLMNPLRYRGYVYDDETGLYYLQSRYYDPTVCRFVNADDNAVLHRVGKSFIFGTNIFMYCNNNPIVNIDSTGYAVANIVGGIIGGVIGALLGYIIADALKLNGFARWALIAAVTVAGAVLGAIIGPYVARAAKHIISIINSGIRVASKAALKAAKKAAKFSVKAKHLSNTGGKFAKFNTSSRKQVSKWISQALKSKNANFYPNSKDSYYIITNMGKKIGTKGQKSIKVVFTKAGKIITAYPVK